MSNHKPATPPQLFARQVEGNSAEWEIITNEPEPWFVATIHDGIDGFPPEQIAKSFVFYANAYPRLVEALKLLHNATLSARVSAGNFSSYDEAHNSAANILRELGEL